MEGGIISLDFLLGKLRAPLATLDRVNQVIAEEQNKVKQRPDDRNAIAPRRRA